MAPLFFQALDFANPFEIVMHRIIWAVPILALVLAVSGKMRQALAVLADRRTILTLVGTAAPISVNWGIFIFAVNSGHVLQASLGYYINPLVNVLLGTVLLGEKLSRPQWAAVGLAGIGVSLLAAGALTTLWISLTLALSFGSYGLIRKQLDVGSVPGLTIESALLLLPSLAVAWYYAQTQGSSFAVSTELSLAIMAGGVVTAFPLLLFAIAARKLPYSMLGFIQFLAPSIVFVLGLTVFGEELKPVQAACFACIWAAAAIFVWDLVARTRKPAAS